MKGEKSLLYFILVACLALTLPGMAQPDVATSAQAATSGQALSSPPDPTADIPWSAGYSGVPDVQAAFNNARRVENAQLGTSLPMLAFPSQAEWDVLNDSQRAFWIVNRERLDRGVHAMHAVEG